MVTVMNGIINTLKILYLNGFSIENIYASSVYASPGLEFNNGYIWSIKNYNCNLNTNTDWLYMVNTNHFSLHRLSMKIVFTMVKISYTTFMFTTSF